MSAARQWRFVRMPEYGICVRVVPDVDATTKAVTGITRLDGVLAERWLGRFLEWAATWSGEICSGERVSSGNDAMTWTCAFAHTGFFLRFRDLRYRYELGVVNSGNEFDHARSAAVEGGCLDADRGFLGHRAWSVRV